MTRSSYEREEPCPTCHGTGIAYTRLGPEHMRDICPVCNGRGVKSETVILDTLDRKETEWDRR